MAGNRLIQTTTKPPSLVAATAGMKSAGIDGEPAASVFTRTALPSASPVTLKRWARISLLPFATADQTTT